jgi:filamentous hemagglutinin
MNSDRFRLVYSQCLGMFVPVSETTKAHGRKSSGKRMRSRYAVAAAVFSMANSYDASAAPPVAPPPVNALPTAGVVGSGAASIKVVNNAMTVNQATQNAIINWGTFNVGANASVNFVQPNSTSAVLNRVSAAGGLSQVYGKLTANGQVYLINPNGILFGNGASVNVNSLVASSLNISDNIFNKGYLSITDGTSAFSGATGYVQVNAGAQINAASGGKVLMFAPNIENNGLINTPDGQTLLAAGQKVYLAASDDPKLRGLLVEVDNGGKTTNTNLGSIIAERGNITLAGIAVNQNGRVKATTSVTANGSIKLQAQDTVKPDQNTSTGFITVKATKGGEVVLGENSITEVLPDSTDKATVLDAATVNKSAVNINAKNIHLMNNAMIVAPSGDVNLVAKQDPSIASTNINANDSHIYFEAGSGIDVSGVGSGSSSPNRANEKAAQVSVASNVVVAELRSTQLRDSPLQRDGILNKAKVYVDARATGIDGNVGTSVADVSGYTAQIQHGLGERLATGGNVKVQSEGDIVFAPTANINVSGGKVDYTGGTVTKTRLLASNGQTYDIANASKDLKYVGIQNVSYQEKGYTTGKDAGSVTFAAPAMVLEGKLKGDAIAGVRQRDAATSPKGASLQVGLDTAKLQSDLTLDASHTASGIPAFGKALSKEQQQTLTLNTNFTAPSGFSDKRYYADGQITVKNGTNIDVKPGGNITLSGGGVNLQSNLTAHAGTIEVLSTTDGIKSATGNVQVGSTSTLDVSGVWTNDKLNPAASEVIATAGGKINISATGKTAGTGDILLSKGSTLNASGGAWLNTSGKLNSGKGGDIKLLASDGILDASPGTRSGKLRLDGALRADSLTTGGSLSLASGTVTIGAKPQGTVGETVLDPEFFRNGGFNAYDVNGLNGLTLANNTIIAPVALTRVLDNGFSAQQSGVDIAKFSHLSLLPATSAALKRKPTNLSLSASAYDSGKLTLGLGSIINTDPGASVSLFGKRQLTVLGSILAPAGNISLATGLVSGETNTFYNNDQTIWLGAKSLLDVSGVVDSYTNTTGFNVGAVKDAGNIKLNATRGEVVAEAGAQLKLNGTHAVLDVKSGNSFTAKDVASKGGNLSITAREGILWDATMSAKGGNENIAAGSLSVAVPLLDLDAVNQTNDGFSNPKEQYPTGPREIVLKATGTAVPKGLKPGDAIGAANNGKATIFADKLQNAGFDNIQFAKSNNIRIAENLSLTTRGSLTLDTPNVIVNNGVKATLNSSFVGMGNSQGLYQDSSAVATPVGGTGALAVNAEYIDLFGKQNLSGTSSDNFNSKGDIQLRGVTAGTDISNTNLLGGLQTAGDMTFSAARIYPSTLSQYTLSSIGKDSTIAFKPSGPDTGVPFSVLGTLNVEAANIKQDGVLRAPFGVINLKASNQLSLGNGSLTSVSADGKTLPFGTTLNGKTWNFDAGDGRIATINALPDKSVNLDGKSVNVAAGSKVDVSGGGDLSAWEFTTGTGGSDDVLAANGVFAVMPDLKAGYMAGNSESYSNNTFKAGDSIYLSGGNGLAAGNYVLLPAHYALLPGAYYVKTVAGTQDFSAQQNLLNKDGSMLVSGYRTQIGGLTADSRSSGFLVASGNIARTQSEFSNATADKFFTKADDATQVSALRLPSDAGRVAISALTNLVLDGKLLTNHAASARGAEVDISSDKIAISNDNSQEAGFLTLSSDKLNAIGAESLLIGGRRSGTTDGTQLDVIASKIKVKAGTNLTGQEIIIAAKDSLSVASGAAIKSSGKAPVNHDAIIIGNADTAGSGDGALLAVSAGPQRELIRKNVVQTKGTLDVQAGATIAATGSAIEDATFSSTINSAVSLAQNGALRLGGPKISFGTPAAPITGLLFDNARIAALGNPSSIELKSYSTLDFYGDVNLGSKDLKNLTLESSGLAGYNNAGKTVTLTAETVKIANPDGATFTPKGTLGTGTLAINATKEIGLGNGTFNTAGFNTVKLRADQVIGEGKGSLAVKGDLAIDAGRITAAGLSDETIKATGNLLTIQHAVTGLAKAPLGGKLTLAADTITHGGIIDLPAGNVTLQATGKAGGDSLILQTGSQINAKGTAQALGAVAVLVDGGKIKLETTNGNVRMDKGAVIDVSATGGGAAGTVITNSAGTVNLAGKLNGGAASGNNVTTPKQGSFELTASKTDFAALNTELERGQFNQSRNIHVAQGDITVGAADKVTARNVTLTTDDGNLTVAGTIDARGDKGGIVKLNAGQLANDGKGNITLASTAKIDASANFAATESAGSKGDGGKVILNTATDSDTSPANGSRITAAAGGVINVSGKGLGSDGTVVLRAPRLGMASANPAGNSIAVTQFGTTVTGANAHIVAEGVKVYKNTGTNVDVTLDGGAVSTMLADNASFLTNANAMASTLGLATDKRFVVAAGDEVRSTGNITVANDIDLHEGGPGALTLRAKNDVKVNGNISAGFTTADATGELTSGGDWTYRLAAGANVNSADVQTTNNTGKGNFTLAAGKLIRTGTGDIEIATAGDFNLASVNSAIYTAGEADTKDYSGLGNFITPTVVNAAYTVNGGDITLASKGNINGAYSTQLPANWLFRQGRVDSKTGLYTKNTSWWAFYRDFKENLGALGGGDVNISSGGAINDLSAVVATNGRVFGTNPSNGKLVENGGGDLTVKAVGDIAGGIYMVDKGTASIRAGGGLRADESGINTALAIGDATVDLATLGQLDLMTVFNPTLTGMSLNNFTPSSFSQRGAVIRNESSFFSTYGADSAIKLTSVASGVELTNKINALLPPISSLVDGDKFEPALRLYPGSLIVAALGGDATIGSKESQNPSIALAPSAKGDLQVATSGSLNLNSVIKMIDSDPAKLPNTLRAAETGVWIALVTNLVGPLQAKNKDQDHAAIALHNDDTQPVVIYAGKDIVSTSAGLFLPKKANISAGNDIKNLSLLGQNLNATDVTTISAGHDILFSQVGAKGVQMGGSGYLDIAAGRDISLGTSDGIVTRGNLDNPYLPEAGANLSVLVGAAVADDKAFIAKYLNPSASTAYSASLTSFVKNVTANTKLTDAEAWAQFQKMDAPLQHQFVQTSFFNELKQAGIEHNDPSSKGFGSYKRGFDAIATYFPKDNYGGKLDLSFSQIKTERGGDLNVMAPGGSIVVGLPKTPPSLIALKSQGGNNADSKLGMFTVKGGNINLFSKGNIDVAQSREFTIAGGDIVNWSSTGDIDAGKGSKTATSAPPPLIRTDAQGNTITDLSGVVSGSGIGTLQTLATAPVGNVYLIAPAGAVNAGDAGIRSSGNLLVAAQRVIGADNISVGGTSSGVPAVTTVNISFNAPASADSAANSKPGDQLGAADKLGENSKMANLLSLISVEVLSLGDESSSTSKKCTDEKTKDGKNKKDCLP